MIRHDRIVNKLEEKLRRYDTYSIIEKFVEYESIGLKGEVDILTYDAKNDYWHFYEVKCRKRHTKATEQYERFKQAHPQLKTMGVMYTPKGVKRLR